MVRLQHRRRRPLADGDARLPGIAVRDRCDRIFVGSVDRRALRGRRGREDRAVRRRDRRLERGIPDLSFAGLAGRIAPGNAIDRIEHGRLRERQRPVCHRRTELGVVDDLAGGRIPVGNDVGARDRNREAERRNRRQHQARHPVRHVRNPLPCRVRRR
jgi:hypothetical protein